ncbi:MAG: anaerobic ribonucleoside-triphosphate reductase activating protein [Parvularculaceae bacterium]
MTMDADDPADLRIGGYQPFSTVDFPDALCAVVFCQGCALRCDYCHNRELLDARRPGTIGRAAIGEHLESRRAGLSMRWFFPAGSRCCSARWPGRAVKAMGMKVGLHTAGASPARLASVLPCLDWVGFDLKAPFNAYAPLTGVDAGLKTKEALDILSRAGVPFEARTTVWPAFHTIDSLVEMAQVAHAAGASRYALQQARDPATRRPLACDVFFDAAQADAVRRAHPNVILRAA